MVQSILLGEHIHLNAFDLEHEAATIAGWTQDPEFWNLYDRDIPRPLSPTQVKKKYSADPKDELTEFPFAIRARVDERLIGLTSLHWVDWSNSNAWLMLAIGSAEDRGRGLEAETLEILLTFAFRELNLFRVQVNAPEYALSWRELLEKHGFKLEVSQREEIQGAGRAWDKLIYGLLAEEWALDVRAGGDENG
jgi:RimJ/RimL family protein N-acetyltransferase